MFKVQSILSTHKINPIHDSILRKNSIALFPLVGVSIPTRLQCLFNCKSTFTLDIKDIKQPKMQEREREIENWLTFETWAMEILSLTFYTVITNQAFFRCIHCVAFVLRIVRAVMVYYHKLYIEWNSKTIMHRMYYFADNKFAAFNIMLWACQSSWDLMHELTLNIEPL